MEFKNTPKPPEEIKKFVSEINELQKKYKLKLTSGDPFSSIEVEDGVFEYCSKDGEPFCENEKGRFYTDSDFKGDGFNE